MARLINILTIVLILTILNTGSLVLVFAQDFNISLPKVTRENSIFETETINGEVYFNEVLTTNDQLRFAWTNIELSLDSKKDPKPKKGFIKAYINEIKEENFIIDFAQSPFKIGNLLPRIKDGKQKVIFVLYLENKQTDKKIIFNLNFSTIVKDPLIKVIKPVSRVVFNKETKNDINLIVENLIIKSGTNLASYGKVNVYLNEVNEKGFLTQILDSETVNNSSKVIIKQSDLGERFVNTIDSEDNKLIFIPINNQGKIFNSNPTELKIITNFQKTLNILSPIVEFLNVNNVKNTITVDEAIKIKISNFKILKFDIRNTNSKSEGYLQILVNDKPHKINFEGNEFNVNQLIPGYKEDKINIKLQLVNSDFTLLDPKVETSIDLFIKKGDIINDVRTEASNWRLVIIGLTVFLILGSVMYIIFRT